MVTTQTSEVLSGQNLLSRQDLSVQKKFSNSYRLAAVATFGGNVRKLRRAVGLKQKDLAAKLDIAKNTMSGLEKEREGFLPGAPMLLRLAKAIGCTVDDLLQDLDAEYEQIKSSRAQQHTSKTGGSDVPASASTESDRFEWQHHDRFVEEASSITKRLVELLAKEKLRAKRRHPKNA